MGKIKEKITNFVANDVNKLCAVLTAFVLSFMPASAKDDKPKKVADGTSKVVEYRSNILNYTDIPIETLSHEYYFYKDLSLYSHRKDKIDSKDNHIKNHIEYPDGSTVYILDDGVIERTDKYGKKTSYNTNMFSKVHIEDTGLIVWDSLIGYETLSSGGVYQVVLPDGELIKKQFVFDYNKNIVTGYKLVSSTGKTT